MCELTISAIEQVCGPNIPGGKALYVANKSDVASITANSATWTASAITMVATKLFKPFKFDRRSLQHKEDSLASGAVNGSIECFFSRDAAATRAALREMCSPSANLCAIVEDGNGVLKFIPEGITLKRNFDSGKEGEDKNGYTVMLEYQGDAAYTFTGTVPLT
jgi:hypothetical protein